MLYIRVQIADLGLKPSVLEARSSELVALLSSRAIQLGEQATAEAARRWLDAGVRSGMASALWTDVRVHDN
jgi:hypothetical protein